MRKMFATNQDKEQLNDFKLGQIDILSWLEVTFQKELSEIEQKRASEILKMDNDQIALLSARYNIINIYLYNIQETKKRIKGE